MADRPAPPKRPMRLRTEPARTYAFAVHTQWVRQWRRERGTVRGRLRDARYRRALRTWINTNLLPPPAPCPVCHWDTIEGHCIFEGHPSHFLAEAWVKADGR